MGSQAARTGLLVSVTLLGEGLDPVSHLLLFGASFSWDVKLALCHARAGCVHRGLSAERGHIAKETQSQHFPLICASLSGDWLSSHTLSNQESEKGKVKKKKKIATLENEESQGKLKFCSLQILEMPEDFEMRHENFFSYYVVCARV